ncbi:MAG TPA: class I SAM-dependent methyltransferase [Thermomicrobiaceae bacterium]|nr:class I SAM-dependent methyltransferase [Thermomicrobiaceae bacterium]
MSVNSREIRRKVREQYAGAGDAYVTSVTHRYGEDLGRLVEVVRPSGEMLALDVATGGGHTALALAPLVGQVVLLDLTPEMLGHARRFLEESGAEPLGYVAADAEQLPFPAGLYDLVTCRIAPHHFANVPAFVDEVARVLAPGGAFVLIDSLAPEDAALNDFINTLERRRDPSHVRSYSRAEWLSFLGHAGLTLEHDEVILKRHDFDPWCRRMRMTPAAEQALSDWTLASPPDCRAYFGVDESDGRVQSFTDHKLLLRAVKQG